MPLRPALHFLSLSALLLLFTGCLSRPTVAYRQVNTETPEFKGAVTQEKARLQAEGQSASDAEKSATRKVTAQIITAEKTRRTHDVTPLVEALADLERPRGCWAFTVTTLRSDDGHAHTTVERYDPFQPEERLWTLLTQDGLAPDEETQATYRHKKLSESKQWRFFKGRPDTDRAQRDALYANFTQTSSDSERVFTFDRDTFKTGPQQLGGFRKTFHVDATAARLLSRSFATKDQSKLGAGMFTIEHEESSIAYTVIDPALPPFPSQTTHRYRRTRFGNDSKEVSIDATYSDYKRVKCYDDRFEVRIGLPTLQDTPQPR